MELPAGRMNDSGKVQESRILTGRYACRQVYQSTAGCLEHPSSLFFLRKFNRKQALAHIVCLQ
jgi:hypothetical protein